MKRIIQTEELALTAVFIYFISQLDIMLNWWIYLILFFLPDVGMLGYLAGNKAGAICYNLFHHRGIAAAILFIGVWLSAQYLQLAGLILLAHASFDRIFGYGLKHFSGFKHTHLGDLK